MKQVKAWGAAVSLAALALSGCSYGAAEGVEIAAAPAAAVELTMPPERDPLELQVLFWSDEQRSVRFREMENSVSKEGKALKSLSLEVMDQQWRAAKRRLEGS